MAPPGPPDPERVAELLERTIELSGAERDGFLSAACGEDEALRREIDALRRAHEAAEIYLGSPTAGSGGADLAEAGSIGPYTLVERLGEGGFGVVYLARQTEPVRREVALKIIKLGMNTEQVIRRFEAERQTLALMDHPSIARVFDAGETEAGRPYFVMELVRGEPLTEHCDKERLGLRARLVLFREVCLAVHHAHQKGVIHRDIKPSNVLVSVADGRAAPKVIDFGIAKAVDSERTGRTLLTEQQQLVGTPEYMSPEQAEGSGVDIDTRSDIYSLGVLLYELLTGTTPFEADRLRSASWAELQRIIREEEPPKPSTRVGAARRGSTTAQRADRETGDWAARVADQRSTDAPSLWRSLRGELDWIVLKALAKERSRRYGTASELAADIERFLGDRPVLASPPSAAYTARKFAKRHRAAFAVAGAIAAALVVTVVALSAAVVQVSRERSLALLAGNAASAARDESEAVTGFLSEMLAAVKPGRSGPAVTVREVLDDAAARIDGAIPARPLVEARLRRTMGESYAALGLYEQAEEHLRRAGELALAELGERDRETLELAALLGSALERQGRYAEAAALLTRTLGRMRETLGEAHETYAATLCTLGLVQSESGELDNAQSTYGEALRIHMAERGPEHVGTLQTLELLGNVRSKMGHYGQAEELLLQALEGMRRRCGDDSPETLVTMGNLAEVYRLQSRFDEAEPLCERVLEIRRRLLGERHPDTLSALDALGALRGHQGRAAEAERLGLQALDASREVLGPAHPDTVRRLNDLAVSMQSLGRFAEAESLYREALEGQRLALGAEHPHTLTTMNNLAAAIGAQDRFDEAEAMNLETLAIRRRVLGDDHFSTLISMNTLANLYIRAGEPARAEPLLREASTRALAVLGDRHGFTGVVLLARGRCLRDLARYSEAERTLLEARRVLEAVYEPGHHYLRHSANELAEVCAALGREEDAAPWAALARPDAASGED